MGCPGAFDIRWMNACFERHLNHNPLGISALCLKSFGIKTQGGALVSATSRSATKRKTERKAGAMGTLGVAIEEGAMGIDLLRQHCGLTPIETAR